MLKEKMDINPEKVTEEIIEFIREKMEFFNRSGVIIGLSGGLDSSCVAAILSRTLEKKKILGLIMPERHSSEDSKKDAELIATTFGISTKFIDLTPALQSFGIYDIFPGKFLSKNGPISRIVSAGYRLIPKSNNPFQEGLLGTKKGWLRYTEAYYRIKHRIRMVYLYYYAEQLNYLVVGTSNKSEDRVGFFVKYGDGATDIMPIAGLYKTQVRQLSRWLGVPDCIIEKSPSPDLLPGITDELAMKISYEKLDLILLGFEKGIGEEEIAKETGVKPRTIKYVENLVSLSEHMRTSPVGYQPV